jgi:hypothetical protein
MPDLAAGRPGNGAAGFPPVRPDDAGLALDGTTGFPPTADARTAEASCPIV